MKKSHFFFLKLSLILVICILASSEVKSQVNPAATEKMVFAHYMGWYGDSLASGDDNLRHWKCGHANQPLIGCYDSRNSSTLTYHLLLAAACGIDGFVINIKDEFDHQTLSALVSTINSIKADNPETFHMQFALSIDDAAFGEHDTAAVETSFTFIRDSVVTKTDSYLKVNDRPVIFLFDYPGHIEASEYRSVADSVFEPDPVLVWNESQEFVMGIVDVCYPWVQPFAGIWDSSGNEWGGRYIDDFFWRVNNIVTPPKLSFAVAGVWPGFDDRINTCWGYGRWMDRQGGAVYDSTWLKVMNYNYGLEIPWVYIETWNDWNEGTEIEPSVEYAYQYPLATIRNIEKFKNSSSSLDTLITDTLKFVVAECIYDTYRRIETGLLDSTTYFPCIKEAITYYLQAEYTKADSLFRKLGVCPVGAQGIKDNGASSPIEFVLFQNYPNPFNPSTTINFNVSRSSYITLKVYNLIGEQVAVLVSKRVNAGYHQVKWDASGLASGVYIYRLEVEDTKDIARQNHVMTKKLLLMK
ncbi:MAG: T9SS type A sorting domain-containing protein [Candidatus Zhuqueibacterota bacterium]